MPRDQVQVPTIPSIQELLGDDYTVEMQQWFPDIESPIYPCGMNMLVQLRAQPKTITFKGGKKFWLADESVTAQNARAQTAIVRALGPSCYRDRRDLTPWPEGNWCTVGQFIRVPMYGGDRIEVPFDRKDGSGDFVLFATFRDMDCLGIIYGDPLKVRTS